MKSWAASLALHGAAFGLATLVWLEPMVEAARSPMRWEVSFTQAPAPPSQPVPEPPRPQPPKKVETPVPKPLPPLPVPPPREAVAPLPPPTPAPRVEPTVAAQAAPEAVPVPALPPAPVAAKSVPPAPAVDAAAEIERRWYLALLERLRAMKRYPMAARRLGQEGVVLIEIRIAPDGRLEGAEVKRGSGYPLLDKDALRLLEAAAETARGQLRPERPTRLEIPIAYRLES